MTSTLHVHIVQFPQYIKQMLLLLFVLRISGQTKTILMHMDGFVKWGNDLNAYIDFVILSTQNYAYSIDSFLLYGMKQLVLYNN